MKKSSASIPLVLLDNFYKLNRFFLIFFALLFPLHGSFITLCYFHELCAFV